MYCATNQFTQLNFFLGPHNKPHGVRGLCKHYHMCFGPKQVQVTCAIHCILCDCTSYTSIIDQPWVSGLQNRNNPAINASKIEHTGIY